MLLKNMLYLLHLIIKHLYFLIFGVKEEKEKKDKKIKSTTHTHTHKYIYIYYSLGITIL